MEVHGVGRVILVRLVPVEALRHPVGGQQVGAGQARHLRRLGLHPGVKVLEYYNNNRSFYSLSDSIM